MQVYEILFGSILMALLWVVILFTGLSYWLSKDRSTDRMMTSIFLFVAFLIPLPIIWWYIFETVVRIPTTSELALFIAMLAFLIAPILKCTHSACVPRTHQIDDRQDQGWIRRNRDFIVFLVLAFFLLVTYTINTGEITLFTVYYFVPALICAAFAIRHIGKEKTILEEAGMSVEKE